MAARTAIPIPVPTLVYDRTIAVLKTAIAQARLGNEERLDAIRRLDRQARLLERTATGPSLPALAAAEMQQSHALGGRSVFGWEPPPSSFKQGAAAPPTPALPRKGGGS
jgi:hypothetical protein